MDHKYTGLLALVAQEHDPGPHTQTWGLAHPTHKVIHSPKNSGEGSGDRTLEAKWTESLLGSGGTWHRGQS